MKGSGGVAANVWLGAAALTYPKGSGSLWVYLNWALGLRAAGCEVTWVEAVDPEMPVAEVRTLVRQLKRRLRPYGLADSVALCSASETPLDACATEGCIPASRARESDLFLNVTYEACPEVLSLAGHTAMLDIDPGLTQVWISEGALELPRHDVWFTIGETAGQSIEAGTQAWVHTPPCVHLESWPVAPPPPAGSPFTTVSHWGDYEWVKLRGEYFCNNKRAGFLPFLRLPSLTRHPLELALGQEADEHLRLAPWEAADRRELERHGWRVVHAHGVASTPERYREYIQRSRGEFSSAKPSTVRFPCAWVSDRTLCYLASGRPAVVQHTGDSDFLPDRAGLLRFSTLEEAAECLEIAAADYRRHSRLARELAAEYFDARRVAANVVDVALSVEVDTDLDREAGMSPARTVAVLGYHKVGQPSPGAWENWYYVPEATFKEQLRVLDEGGWEALDVPAFVRGIADPRTLPSRAALVTFDDAYRSLIACALPCLQGRPGAVFVATDFVGQMNGFDANTDQPPERICDWKDLKALRDASVSVQSHSASHPEFSALSEGLLDAELSRSKHVLEERLESPVQLLAYPYGDAGRDSHAVGEALRRRGYVAAFLYGGGPVTLPAQDPFRIDRIAMGPDTDLEAELAAAGLAAG